MTAYFAILLGGFLCSAIGWVAGYACATLRHHWHHAGLTGEHTYRRGPRANRHNAIQCVAGGEVA